MIPAKLMVGDLFLFSFNQGSEQVVAGVRNLFRFGLIANQNYFAPIFLSHGSGLNVRAPLPQ
ncbi:MAG: hypothetical protein ABIP71_08610 [Verrucomicrobiota bacterium]